MFKRTSLGYKLSTLALVGTGSAAAAAYISLDSRSSLHDKVIVPFVRGFVDPETAHKLAVAYYENRCISPRERPNWAAAHDPNNQLAVTLFTHSANPKVKPVRLANPLGLAAGFDKDAKLVDTLFGFGFAYAEIGSVTPLPQPGNPTPRVFRLDRDRAVINRYGFNSAGHYAVLAQLHKRPAYRQGLVGSGLEDRCLAVNLGKNKEGDEINDYVTGVKTFGSIADVLVVNVSSPNTPGLRALQGEDKLTTLLKSVVEARDALTRASLPPVVVKIAPDLSESEIKSIASSVRAANVEGVIVSNTTISRPDSLASKPELVSQTGGLSGPPVKPLSLKVVRSLRKFLGSETTIIGCGGISSGKDALEYAAAGADAVQLYTSMAFYGPGIATHVKEGILQELGSKSWADVVAK